jgi:hypothetical protein
VPQTEGREYENTQLQVRRMPTEDAGRIPQEYEEMPPGCRLDAGMPRCQDAGIDMQSYGIEINFQTGTGVSPTSTKPCLLCQMTSRAGLQ